MPTTLASTWSRRLIRWTAPLVPRDRRVDWRDEWLAEIAAGESAGVRSGAPAPSLFRHSLGAVVDAFWLRQRSIADLAWIDDLRHGWRQLHQQTGFAVTAIGVLALGMAAAVTAFSVVTQVLLRPLPYPDPQRLVTLWDRPAGSAARTDVAPGNFIDWRERARSFQALAGVDPYTYDYTGGDRPEVLRGLRVTEGFFEIFGLPPLHGRFFRPEEHTKGKAQVAVVTEAFWRSHLGADPAVIGRVLLLGDEAPVIVGITRADFDPHFLSANALRRVAVWTPKGIEEYEPRIRASGYWNVVGRLADGQPLEAAQAEMDAVASQLEAENPRTNKGARIEVLSFRDHLVGDVRGALVLFVAAVAAVLLIACVNVTNLLLARGSARHQELAIRTALGANRSRLVGQLLIESLLLAVVASTIALVLAVAALRLLVLYGPRDVVWIDTLHLDAAALAFAVALTVVVAVAAGLVPALRLSLSGLRAFGHRGATADRSQRRIRSVLVAAEVALALVLVSGSTLLLRSFVNLLNVERGFQSRGVAALQIFAWDRNPTPAARRSFVERALARVAALPGVEAAGAVRAMPFIEANIDIGGVFRIVGRPAPAQGEEPRASFNIATPRYFEVMRIPLLRGRFLADGDGSEAPRVAVISDALAQKYWPGADPIGERLAFRESGQPLEVEIVGIVGSMRHERLDEDPRPELFVPHAQVPNGSMTLVARTSLDPRLLIEPAKAEVWAVDPLQTFYRTATVDELVDRTLTTRRFALLVLAGFSTLALLLAAAGLYGVLSAIVSQYRREIGVRMALGARWLDIVQLVVSRGLLVAAIGVGVGLVGVLGLSRTLRSFLFSVGPNDPLAIGGAAFLMLVVAGLACYIPARRAALSDPVEVLRVE